MFEHRNAPLLPRALFLRRLARNAGIGGILIVGSLGIGIMGYRYACKYVWIDALLNASMILGGMGPVGDLTNTNPTQMPPEGKLFASFYALFSGIAFLGIVAVLFAPIYHRFIHRFHLDLEDKDGSEKGADGGMR